MSVSPNDYDRIMVFPSNNSDRVMMVSPNDSNRAMLVFPYDSEGIIYLNSRGLARGEADRPNRCGNPR